MIDDPRKAHRLAVLLFIGQVSLTSVFQAVVKGLAADLPAAEILFFRCLFGLVALAPVLWWRTGVVLPASRDPVAHLLRGLTALVAILANFTALALLPLAMSTVLDFTVPIFLALAGPLAGERLGAMGWWWVLVGFAGCVVLAAPDGSPVAVTGLMAGLVASALGALCAVQLRRLPPEDGTAKAVLSLTAVSMAGSGLALPAVWVTPTMGAWAGLALLGVLGTIMQLAATRAFLLAPPSLIAPLDYLRLPLAVAIGFAVWGDVPDLHRLAGAALIVAGSFGVLRMGWTKG